MYPLQLLHKNIDKFSRGEHIQANELDSSDEVAQVANAFCDAAATIDTLQKSRILFLRNIMHELKTPITRGKLIVHTLDDTLHDKSTLLDTFNVMEAQLKELSDIESITSKAQSLEIKEYALIDIVENVYDILYFDEVSSSISNEIVKVDFNLFSIALKNLIDNARKYKEANSQIKLEFQNNTLSVINRGKAFSKNIENFFEAFERDCSDSKTEGFGLGLYIVNEVVTRHNFLFEHEYLDGEHFFKIVLGTVTNSVSIR